MSDLHKNILEEQEKIKAIGITEDLYDTFTEKFQSEAKNLFLHLTISTGSENLQKLEVLLQYEREEEDKFRLAQYEIARLVESTADMYSINTNQIDRLENQMQLVDWKNLSVEMFTELRVDDFNVFFGEHYKIRNIIHEIQSLGNDPQSSDMADYLAAKYWLHTPFEQELLNPNELKSRFEESVAINPSDVMVTISEAQILLDGGAIYSLQLSNPELSGEAAPYWLTIINGENLEKIRPEKAMDVRKELSSIPIMETLGLISIEELAEKIERGQKVSLTYYEGPELETVVLRANPAEASIDIDFIDSVRDLVEEALDPEQDIKYQKVNVSASNLRREDLKNLEDNIKSYGFSSDTIPGLLEQIRQGKTEFTLKSWGMIDDSEYQAILNFRKNNLDKPGLESFSLTVGAEKANDRFFQSFKTTGPLPVTLDQAFFLMQEKPVVIELKGQDGLMVPTWMKMEFEKKLPDGNYPIMPILEQRLNVKDELNRYDIPNLPYQNILDKMVRLLETGHELKVSIAGNEKADQYFISANPYRNAIDIYDAAHRLVPNIELINKNNETRGNSNDLNSPDQGHSRRKK